MSENTLVIDGVNVNRLVDEYKTPMYVLSDKKLTENFESIVDNFKNKYENVAVHFAAKSFLNLGILKYVKKYGFGIDVVSRGELFIALKGGIDPKEIEFHGNNKTIEEIESGIDCNVGLFVVDNERELKIINTIAKDKGKVQDVIFRITPEIGGGSNKKIQTGQKDSKFGIPMAENIFIDVVNTIKNLSNVNFKGIHFHVGSQLMNSESQINAVRNIVPILKSLKRDIGIEIEVMNVGGGFGVHYTEGLEIESIDKSLENIMNEIEIVFKNLDYSSRPKIIIEPGRFLVAEAGWTLYTVGTIKQIPGIRTYASVDGGMTDNIRPTLYAAEYRAVVANKLNDEPVKNYTIAGKYCETGDILIENIMLPELESNDILAVYATGAYNYTMFSNYNKALRPPVILVKDGESQIMTRRQTLDDLIAFDEEINI